MKALACVCLLTFAGVAQAQTAYLDESSNLGNLTMFAGASPFNIADEFNILPTWGIGSVTITVHGQNGVGVCSGRGCGGRVPTYKTTFAQPILYSATALMAPDGTVTWTEVAPVTDTSGNPVTFNCTSSSQSPCLEWQYTGNLPPTPYMLSLSGTSCGGYLCQLPGNSRVYVTTHFAP